MGPNQIRARERVLINVMVVAKLSLIEDYVNVNFGQNPFNSSYDFWY